MVLGVWQKIGFALTLQIKDNLFQLAIQYLSTNLLLVESLRDQF